jgi:GH15 family glucan-1,4-alpha-glucosidase
VARPIEDHALIGDCHAAALVDREGDMDWLCLPCFDSGACFAALLGGPEHGHWRIGPAGGEGAVRRRYRDGTMVLETEFEVGGAAVRLIDFMPMSNERWDVVRIVEGLRGRMPMAMELVIRFDYGSIVPWVRRVDGTLLATAGPDTLELHSRVHAHGRDMTTVAAFDVQAGECVPFVLNYRPSHEDAQPAIDAGEALTRTTEAWRAWSDRCTYQGRWREPVLRSLLTLKALTYHPTGGIVAAPTTSLPERLGGVRNWDYRYCWLRDAAFALGALLRSGYKAEAEAWREWLLRAVAGSPCDLQILYGITGTRRLDETELPWLPGHRDSAPVRTGNAAARQLQLDVYGEVIETLHLARRAGIPPEPHAWQIELAMLEDLESRWREPDEGIWEVRGGRRHFTHSKVMAWVAFDRAIKDAEALGLQGPVARWRRTREEIHAQVCESGIDGRRGCFVQHYGGTDVDASLLLIPVVGFLPASDRRVQATVDAVRDDLGFDGLMLRYPSHGRVDGLPAGEGAFLPCSFWLADALALAGRRDEATALFDRLLDLRNDVGLLAEEVDPRDGGMLGNFPQALSHMALVTTAHLLSMAPDALVQATREGERPGVGETTGEPSARA